MSVTTVYYVTDVPDIRSTTRYQHSLAIGELSDHSLLLTHSQPPSEIVERYDDVRILPGNQIRQVRQAVKIVSKENHRGALRFITTGQYEPILAGFISDATWICDIYDDPMQGALSHPRSYHQVLSRIRRRLIPQADHRVYSIHPRHSRIDGKDGTTRFVINGAPTSLFDFTPQKFEPPIRFVQVGKTKLEWGLEPVLQALSEISIPFEFDMYGKRSPELDAFIDELGLESQVTMHGLTAHNKVKTAIQQAHMGFCILPDRGDYRYHYPIKVGEYLAAGTLPVVSRFAGILDLAKNAGLYAEPNTDSVKRLLEDSLSMSDKEYQEMSKEARKRAEQIAWEDERKWFYQQAVS